MGVRPAVEHRHSRQGLGRGGRQGLGGRGPFQSFFMLFSPLQRRKLNESFTGFASLFAGMIVMSIVLSTERQSRDRMVNDPTGSKTYYTNDIETMSSGAIKIKDEKTGNMVTLQSSEVKEISKSEFKEALKGEKKK